MMDKYKQTTSHIYKGRYRLAADIGSLIVTFTMIGELWGGDDNKERNK